MPKRVPRHIPPQPDDLFYRYIPLTQGQNAKVDVEDYEWLSQWNWQALWDPKVKSFYAVRKNPPPKSRMMKMHRQILGAIEGETVDHKNHDTLDNRRYNLRKCSAQQNAYNQGPSAKNTTGFKGVHKRKDRNIWEVQMRINGKKKYIGTYYSAEDAARAYDSIAKELHGSFAWLNFAR
jgi:hypothetical protein